MKTDFQMQRAQTMTGDFRCSYSHLCFRRVFLLRLISVLRMFQTFSHSQCISTLSYLVVHCHALSMLLARLQSGLHQPRRMGTFCLQYEYRHPNTHIYIYVCICKLYITKASQRLSEVVPCERSEIRGCGG